MIGITGGAGFLGSHLVDAFVQRGQKVRVLDNFSGPDAMRRLRRLERLGNRVKLVDGDVRDPAALDTFLRKCDRVYHLARTRDDHAWSEQPERTFDEALAGIRTLIAGLERHGVDQLILGSSGQVYGETRRTGADGRTLPEPLGLVGVCDLAVEGVARTWAVGHRQLTILRAFEVYGPRMATDHIVHRYLTALDQEIPVALPGDGQSVRDYVFAADWVRLAMQARRVQTERPAVFVVASGVPTSALDLVAAVRRVTARFAETEVGPTSRNEALVCVGDPTDTARQLHLRPEVDLDDGLTRTLAWIRKRS